ncbi:unnamed protein product [Notodromas monacha]|uniref:alkaline phosphatase n=1 Tax=Notodromas monacha TaxID=399045 RepID=A0A7R9GEC3_9CRUS|nr:unnamed protein product [Notodromas monacha]CAG0917723.1 unnamed protein product [Notodromas monacha]
MPGKGRVLFNGLFNKDHMQYEADRNGTPANGEPHLSEMTSAALELLGGHRNGFVLMVEGGRVDHALHTNNAKRAIIELLAVEQAIEAALAQTNRNETLIIVTADHSHVMTFNGYPERGNPILALAAPMATARSILESLEPNLLEIDFHEKAINDTQLLLFSKQLEEELFFKKKNPAEGLVVWQALLNQDLLVDQITKPTAEKVNLKYNPSKNFGLPPEIAAIFMREVAVSVDGQTVLDGSRDLFS